MTKSDNFSVSWSDSGALLGIEFDGKAFEPVMGRSFFEIDGFPASARSNSDNGGYHLQADGSADPSKRGAPSASSGTDLAGRAPRAGVVKVTDANSEVGLVFNQGSGPAEVAAADAEDADPTAGAPSAESVGLSLGFPVDSEIHLAEYYNIGRKLDTDMPVGESYEGKLAYGYIVVRAAGMWLRFRADRPSMNGLTVRIVRLPTMFAVTMRWQPGDPLRIRPFVSLNEAIADFATRLETDHGIKKLADDPATPAWVRDTRLIFTVDMLRSNFEITHDFADVERLSGELKRAGCPENSVIYIPGWQGAYDAAHPTYRPAEELGGEPAFRKMVDAAHRNGYKIMIHATGWGIDPYHPDIDELMKLAKKEENGDFQGWQFGYVRRPEMIDLGFFTERMTVGSGGTDGSAPPLTVTTPPAPANCEALFSVGGLSGSTARLRLTCGRRSITSPPGWFADHDEYHFPFPLMLAIGANEVTFSIVEGTSDGNRPATELWYQIRYSFIPESPYTSWTWPILRADTENPEYQRIFVENLSGVVKDFGIDAVHVDATTLGWPPGVRQMFYKLKDALPGIPINTELYTEFEGLGYWGFSQNATQTLIAKRAGPQEQQSLQIKCGLPELYDWLDKPSPVCDFAWDYIRTYPHLCAINAFVPVGKICNTFPARQLPAKIEEHWRVLRDAKRLGYIPTLRVNFREYGLDEETVKAIKEFGS